MNYFTPDHYVARHVGGPAAEAEAAWQAQVDRYEADLHAVWGQLSPAVTRLLDGVALEGAALLGLARQPEALSVTLRLPGHAGELLSLTYGLVGEPTVQRDLFPASCSAARPACAADELEVLPGGVFRHRLLFSNGWEVAVDFRDVRWSLAQCLFPLDA